MVRENPRRWSRIPPPLDRLLLRLPLRRLDLANDGLTGALNQLVARCLEVLDESDTGDLEALVTRALDLGDLLFGAGGLERGRTS